MNLVLLHAAEIGGDAVATVSGERARHMLATLKVAPGHDVRVGVVDGARGIGRVTAVDGGAVTLRCALDAVVPPRPAVDVLLALPRPKVMRRLWAQLAAVGVGQIILTNAGRVERQYFDTHVLSPHSYEPLLIEGLQQAQDTRMPRVSVHRQFRKLVEDDLDGLFGGGRRLVAHPGGNRRRPDTARARQAERVLLAIGPEGGWNAFELALLDAHGFQAIDMGARTLRTDTACIALLALVHDRLRAAPDA